MESKFSCLQEKEGGGGGNEETLCYFKLLSIFCPQIDGLLKLHRSQRLNYAIIYKNFTILENYKCILDNKSKTNC